MDFRIPDMEMPQPPPRHNKKTQKSRRFVVRWVKLHQRWAIALQQSKSVSAYQLAHTILFEEFKRKQIGGQIVLSMEMTKMPSSTRKRATEELIKLGLIKVSKHGKQAVRVTKVII